MTAMWKPAFVLVLLMSTIQGQCKPNFAILQSISALACYDSGNYNSYMYYGRISAVMQQNHVLYLQHC